MAGDRKLEIIISGDAKGAQKALGETGAGADQLGGKFTALGKTVALGGVAIAGAAVGIGAALFKVGADFDDVYDKIRVSTGASGAVLENYKDDFRAVFASVPATMEDAGTAVAGFGQALGDTGPRMQELSKQVLELSRITDTDLTSNMDASIGVIKNWNLEGADMTSTMDAIFRASQLSGLSFGDLSTQLAANGNTFRALGFNVEQATTVLAGLAKGGIDASEVMPSLGKAMAAAAKDGKSAQDVYQGLIRSIKEAPSDTAAASIAFDVLGAKAGPKFAQLIRDGKYSFDALGESIAEGTETIIGAGKETQDFGEKWQMIKNRVLLKLEPVAMRVFDSVGAAMDKLGPILDNRVIPALKSLGAFVDKYKPAFLALAGIISGVLTVAFINWGIQSTIAGAKAVASFVAAQAKAVMSAASMVASIATTIASYIALGITSLATGAQMAAAWLIGLGPIALVIAAIAGAAALIVVHWDTIVGAAKAAWNWISENWPLILAILTGPIGLAVLAITRNWDTIKSGVSGVKDWIVGRFNDVVGFITGLPDRITRATSGMWDGIKKAFKATINWVIRGWNRLEFKLPTVDTHIPGVGKIGGWTLGTPDIAELHTGGVFRASSPGGEGLALLRDGERVTTPFSSMGGGGMVVNVYVTNSVGVDGRAVQRWLMANLNLAQLNGIR